LPTTDFPPQPDSRAKAASAATKVTIVLMETIRARGRIRCKSGLRR
jgi:hypothetical protein